MAEIKPRYRKRDHPSYFIHVGIKARVGKVKCYENVTLAPEWEDCENFRDWCDQQVGFNQIDENGYYFEIDKDIFSPYDNKSYSPETCCFVPRAINGMFKYTGRGGDKAFDGIHFNNFSETFQVSVSTDDGYKNLGNFYNQLEAFYCLKEFRQNKLKELAERYKDKLDGRVYEYLISWDIDYPHCKIAGAEPVPVCIGYAGDCGYYHYNPYPRYSTSFYEDGSSWRNNSDPYTRYEDV